VRAQRAHNCRSALSRAVWVPWGTSVGSHRPDRLIELTGRCDPCSRGGLYFALAWVGAIALACLLALRDRPEFADVQANSWVWLVVFAIPAAASAVIAIRTPAILVVTALASGYFGATGSRGTLRDTHSTAAVGIVTGPVFAFLLVSVGFVVDLGWPWAGGKRRRT
jgi:hypothetical protein